LVENHVLGRLAVIGRSKSWITSRSTIDTAIGTSNLLHCYERHDTMVLLPWGSTRGWKMQKASDNIVLLPNLQENFYRCMQFFTAMNDTTVLLPWGSTRGWNEYWKLASDDIVLLPNLQENFYRCMQL
jgi:hypothetical protein